MIRITTGTAKNKKLKVPNIDGIRSVQEVSKMAIFSILGEKVSGTNCLDLYAGSGNLGIEALSRGAKWCDFVDEHPKAIKVIEENLKNCDFTEKSEVIRKDAIKYSANTEKKYDLIFVDPFYENTSHIFLFENLEEILNESGFIIFLHGLELDLEKNISKTQLKLVTQRKFGRSMFSILEK